MGVMIVERSEERKCRSDRFLYPHPGVGIVACACQTTHNNANASLLESSSLHPRTVRKMHEVILLTPSWALLSMTGEKDIFILIDPRR